MNMIILAAGTGNRLKPITADRPKCMVPLEGKPLLYWQTNTARAAGVKNIVVVRGFCKETVQGEELTFVENKRFAETNMLQTLWCAAEYFGDSFIVSYGDIVYEPSVLEALLKSPHDISVVVDREWKSYWEKRVDNVLDDAESLRLADDGRITDIGNKETSLERIQAQYIGLLSFKGKSVQLAKDLFEKERKAHQDGRTLISTKRNFDMLYMTDFLQGLINSGTDIHAVPINEKWLEIDSHRDLELAQKFALTSGNTLTINRNTP
ncbi:MAG: phosphocholine cytidylyltransferase family protein [Oligoflexia bacterium]|nr:phosphocholine cytidylyltransferase family protein [Oligoflexia bacterium]